MARLSTMHLVKITRTIEVLQRSKSAIRERMVNGLRRAKDDMAPLIRDEKGWPLKDDVMYDSEWPTGQNSLLFAGSVLGRADYLALWKKLPADSRVEEVIRNFFVRQPVLWVVAPTLSCEDRRMEHQARLEK